MKPKTIMAGVVIALAATGVIFGVQYFRSGPAPAKIAFACPYEGCGWTGTATVSVGEPYPPKCPKCGKTGVLPVATCKKCGHQQVLNEQLKQWIPGRENLPSGTKCEKCGGRIVHGD